MEENKINERLLAKMENEENEFLSELLDANPIEVLFMSRRYHVNEAILEALRKKPLSEKQALALLRCSRPLHTVFKQWDRMYAQRQGLFQKALVRSADHLLLLRALPFKGKGGDEK